MRKLLVLGGGTAGTMIVNKLRRALTAAIGRSRSSTRTMRTITSPGTCSSRSVPTRPIRSPGPGMRFCPTGSTSSSVRSTSSTPPMELSRWPAAGRCRMTTWSSPRAWRPAPTRHRECWRAMAKEHLRLLQPRRCAGAREGPGRFRRWPVRRAHHRHADQMPGRAAGIHLPRRRLLPAPGHPGSGRDGVCDTAVRRFHQAHLVGAAGHDAGRAKGRGRDRLPGRAHRPGRRKCWSPTTNGRSPSTFWSRFR